MSLEQNTKAELIEIIHAKEEAITNAFNEMAKASEKEADLIAQLEKAADNEAILIGKLDSTEKLLQEANAAKFYQETELMAVIGELQKEVITQEVKAKGPQTVSLTLAGEETRSFVITCPYFIHNGQKTPATAITDNSEILQELVAMGAGILKEIHS